MSASLTFIPRWHKHEPLRLGPKTMSEYQLYCFGESGPAYKVAFMLSACKLDWQPIAVDFLNGETRTSEYRTQVNEMGEVPVLVHRGRKLVQSAAILSYLAKETGKFNGQNPQEDYDILSWMLFDNHKFSSNLGTLRFLVAFAKTGETPVTEFLRARVMAALAIVEKHLDTRQFMIGDAPTIADISMCGYIFHPEGCGIDFTEFHNLERWKADMARIPGWKMPYDMIARAAPKRS